MIGENQKIPNSGETNITQIEFATLLNNIPMSLLKNVDNLFDLPYISSGLNVSIPYVRWFKYWNNKIEIPYDI